MSGKEEAEEDDNLSMDIDGDKQEDASGKSEASGKKKVTASLHEIGGQDDTLMWVEKYRPKTLTELISHQQIISTITSLIDQNRLPHLLLYGPPGTGKTSTILACARKLYGPKFSSMILELNASDDRGIGVVRDQIKNFASTSQLFSGGFKLIVLDEADSMSSEAQAALRRVIEKYTKNTRFCLIGNYINKIIPALQSRCTRFRFGPLDTAQIEGRLDFVVKEEKINMRPGGLEAIMTLAQGDMRKCLNVLQACHLAYPEVSTENVYLCTGKPLPKDIEHMLDLLLNKPFKEAHDAILELQTRKGLSLTDIVEYVHELVLRVRFPPPIIAQLLARLADVQHRLAFGTSERLQLGALVGAFNLAANDTVKLQKTEAA